MNELNGTPAQSPRPLTPSAVAFAPPGPPPRSPGVLRDLAFAITNRFEGGHPGSLQTLDDGIVSYGSHQATLRSGSLGKILERYLSSSATPAAERLREYSSLVAARSPSLASDTEFLSLLVIAAEEDAMAAAQDEVFATDYWRPSYNRASALGLESPLAFAAFYDTAVQGGLATIASRTAALLGPGSFTEAEYLRAFLESRRDYLLEIAELKRLSGKPLQAEMLETAAATRIGFFEAKLESGNFNLD